MTRLQFRKGNFPPRNPLKSLKAAKESRSRRRRSPLPGSYGRVGWWGSSDRWARLSRSQETARAPPPSLPPRAGRGDLIHGEVRKGNFPPRKALKSLETEKESR